jgi:hypothetical protein
MDEGLAEAFFMSLTLGPWSRPREGAGDELFEGDELDAAMDVAAGARAMAPCSRLQRTLQGTASASPGQMRRAWESKSLTLGP